MVKNTGFRLVSQEELLPFLKHKFGFIEEDGRKTVVGLGILHNGKLISHCIVSKEENELPMIRYVESLSGTSSDAKLFRKEFGVTPAGYLQEEFIRKGFRSFKVRALSHTGKRLVNRLKMRGLIAQSKGTSITHSDVVARDKWINLAKSRKRLLR